MPAEVGGRRSKVPLDEVEEEEPEDRPLQPSRGKVVVSPQDAPAGEEEEIGFGARGEEEVIQGDLIFVVVSLSVYTCFVCIGVC